MGLVGVRLVGIMGLVSLVIAGHLLYTGLGDGVWRPVSDLRKGEGGVRRT